MKILVVSPALPSPAMRMRGVNTNVPLRMIAELGHDVRAVVPVPWAPPLPRRAWRARRDIPLAEMDGVVPVAHPRYVSLGRWLTPGTIALQRRLFWRALRPHVRALAESPDAIVHIHSAALTGAVAGRVKPARLVVSMWDHELFELVGGDRAWRDAVADTLRAADTVVYISKTLRAAGEDLIGPHPSRVIPLAVDEYPDIVPRPDDAFTVVTAARLVARKQVDLLIEAFARLHAHAPSSRLVILGDGPEREALEKLIARLGLSGAVELTGHRTHREVRERLARGHVFALPSVRESLGTVYFEAMSVGLPVIGVAGEGVAEHVSHGRDGFLIEPRDGAALAGILIRLYDDPELRARVGDAGRDLLTRSGARWSDHVQAHLELFRSLLHPGGPGGPVQGTTRRV